MSGECKAIKVDPKRVLTSKEEKRLKAEKNKKKKEAIRLKAEKEAMRLKANEDAKLLEDEKVEYNKKVQIMVELMNNNNNCFAKQIKDSDPGTYHILINSTARTCVTYGISTLATLYIARLGKGSNGTVYSVEYNIFRFALKITDTYSGKKEAEIMRKVENGKGPNKQYVIRLLDEPFEYEGFVCLPIELCKCDLYARLRNPISKDEAKILLKQSLLAVSALRYHGIMHRDIKLENLFLDFNGNIKIGDFGLSAVDIGPGKRLHVCSRWYRPPECLKGSDNYGINIDVWSLGCVAFEIANNVNYGGGDILFPGNATPMSGEQYTLYGSNGMMTLIDNFHANVNKSKTNTLQLFKDVFGEDFGNHLLNFLSIEPLERDFAFNALMKLIQMA